MLIKLMVRTPAAHIEDYTFLTPFAAVPLYTWQAWGVSSETQREFRIVRAPSVS